MIFSESDSGLGTGIESFIFAANAPCLHNLCHSESKTLCQRSQSQIWKHIKSNRGKREMTGAHRDSPSSSGSSSRRGGPSASSSTNEISRSNQGVDMCAATEGITCCICLDVISAREVQWVLGFIVAEVIASQQT